jgi:hypothetical protein
LTCVKARGRPSRYKNGMADTPQTIRQRIEYYRRMLADGVSAELARVYLDQIARDHAKLREVSEAEPPDPDPAAPRRR